MPSTDRSARPTPSPGNGAPTVHLIPWTGSDEELARVLVEGGAAGARSLYDRFGADVNRVLWKLLGADEAHDDLVQQVFLAVLDGLPTLRDPSKLRSWIVGIAVHTVRCELRQRRFRRLLVGRRLPVVAVPGIDHEGRSVLSRVYAILDRLPVDERTAFVLRRIDERSLPEVAELCRCSLATVKRRLARADERFRRRLRDEPAIVEWLDRQGGHHGT